MDRPKEHSAATAPRFGVRWLKEILSSAWRLPKESTDSNTRRSFEEALTNKNAAVLLLDIDRLRAVNQALGRNAGDRVLAAITSRITNTIAGGQVARIGGDEFAVVLPGVPLDEAEQLARQLIADAALPMIFENGQHVAVSAGIGIAIGQGPALLEQAETAMYRAKAGGSGRYAIFDTGMRTSAVEDLRLAEEIQRAVHRRELSLHYEPIVRLTDRHVAGFEALLRWQHPVRGLISFGPYIRTIEESGLIVPIGRQVIDDACRQLASWRSQSHDPHDEPLSLSVNVSGRQLADPGFLDHLKLVLMETGVNPESLKLEITESVMMQDDGENVLWRVKDLGVSLHMDDFGTGYSSLSRLHRFPVDTLKIDRSFVRNTSARRDYAAVLHAIVTLAHNLGMEVIAEGLETAGQVSLLEGLDADYGQGYFFSKAIPSSEIENFLHALPAPR